MTICIKSGFSCTCQPDEAVWCPDYRPDEYVKYLMQAIIDLRKDLAPPAVPDAPPMQGDDAQLCKRLLTFYSGADIDSAIARIIGLAVRAEAAESLVAQQKERIAELESERMDILNGAGKIVGTITDAAAERIAELEKDAARYRWLRENAEYTPHGATCDGYPVGYEVPTIVCDKGIGTDAKIDAAIDAALAADREGETK